MTHLEYHHEYFYGITVDHLYRDCPNLQRAIEHTGWLHPNMRIGDPGLTTKDPMGDDVCGLCQHRWKQRHWADR